MIHVCTPSSFGGVKAQLHTYIDETLLYIFDRPVLPASPAGPLISNAEIKNTGSDGCIGFTQ